MPSTMSGLLYVITTAVILIGSNMTAIVYQVSTPDNQYYFGLLVHQYTDAVFSKLNQTELIGQITVFLVWASAGAAAYILVWFILDTYIVIHNDIVIGTTYTSVETHGHARYWIELCRRGLFRASAVLLILLLTSITVQIWYPLSVTMVGIWVTNVHLLPNWGLLLEAVLGWIVVLHIGVVFLRLVLLRTRVFA